MPDALPLCALAIMSLVVGAKTSRIGGRCLWQGKPALLFRGPQLFLLSACYDFRELQTSLLNVFTAGYFTQI